MVTKGKVTKVMVTTGMVTKGMVTKGMATEVISPLEVLQYPSILCLLVF